MGNIDKEKEIQKVYYEKYGMKYDDALFRVNLICQMLGRDKGFKHILDGAGFFPTAHVLADNYPGSRVVIYNLYSEDDILHQFYDNIEHIQGDLTNIKLPDNYFDLVFLGEVIEHVYDLPKCLEEVRRVLKPGGYLAITTPNLAAWYNRILLLIGKCPINYQPSPIRYDRALLEKHRKAYGDPHQVEFPLHHFHIRVFTLDKLIDYLKHRGFEIEQYKVYNCSTPDRKLAFIRKMLGYMLTYGARENIGVISRNLKK